MNDYAEELRRRWIREDAAMQSYAHFTPKAKTILERLREVREAMGEKWIAHRHSSFVWHREPTVLVRK